MAAEFFPQMTLKLFWVLLT